MKKAAKPETWLAKSFDLRFPLAWWRFVDPLAGFSRFLQLGQRITDALHLGLAWDFYQARIRLRANFEKLVQDKAAMELRRCVNDLLNFYRERGYAIDSGLDEIILDDLISSLADDRNLVEQMVTLQALRESRKALYYRIWAIWAAEIKIGPGLVHAYVAKRVGED